MAGSYRSSNVGGAGILLADCSNERRPIDERAVEYGQCVGLPKLGAALASSAAREKSEGKGIADASSRSAVGPNVNVCVSGQGDRLSRFGASGRKTSESKKHKSR